MITFMYILFGILILLASCSVAGAIFNQDMIMLAIAVLLFAAASLIFLEIRKMQKNPFD
jgi:positive regulator of sigma E activity